MHHFFIDPELINFQRVIFPKEIAHQIKHVLRLTTNDIVTVLDNSGMLYQVRLEKVDTRSQLFGEIESSTLNETEPKTKVTLYFSLTAREKMDWILQKGTEVGVSVFQPFVSSRSLVRTVEISGNKLDRWNRIIREAAEQSGRGRLPELNLPQNLIPNLDSFIDNHDLSMIAWENAFNKGEDVNKLLDQFSGFRIGLFIGPEGGFSLNEVETGLGLGCKMVSLGPRIMRMETAAIVFPAIVLHELEEKSANFPLL